MRTAATVPEGPDESSPVRSAGNCVKVSVPGGRSNARLLGAHTASRAQATIDRPLWDGRIFFTISRHFVPGYYQISLRDINNLATDFDRGDVGFSIRSVSRILSTMISIRSDSSCCALAKSLGKRASRCGSTASICLHVPSPFVRKSTQVQEYRLVATERTSTP